MQHLVRIVQARRRWQLLLVFGLVAVSYLAFSPNPPQQISTGWDKLNHAAAFVALTFTACLGFPGARRSFALVLLAMLALGGLIEVVQGFVPGRDSEWADLLADAVGIAIGALMALPLLAAAKTRR